MQGSSKISAINSQSYDQCVRFYGVPNHIGATVNKWANIVNAVLDKYYRYYFKHGFRLLAVKNTLAHP